MFWGTFIWSYSFSFSYQMMNSLPIEVIDQTLQDLLELLLPSGIIVEITNRTSRRKSKCKYSPQANLSRVKMSSNLEVKLNKEKKYLF